MSCLYSQRRLFHTCPPSGNTPWISSAICAGAAHTDQKATKLLVADRNAPVGYGQKELLVCYLARQERTTYFRRQNATARRVRPCALTPCPCENGDPSVRL